MTPQALALALCVAAGAACHAPARAAADFALAEERALEWGPHAVGFRSSWALDESRTYTSAFDQGASYGREPAPRPILVNLWYPARASDGPAMLHRGYLELHGQGSLKPFASALTAYERGIVVQEVFGKEESALEKDERRFLDELLDSPTRSRRDAPAETGPFPLAIYHAGAGSSYEDDAVLCEVLASHGYVVLGSAYPKADGSSLGIDGTEGSARDMGFLIERARELSFCDAERVALIGHSAGAQAILRWAVHADCPADALVLLDTTQDYYALGFPLHARLVADVDPHSSELDAPLLVVAGPEAQFQLCDRFAGSARTYLTIPDLGHNEYISQGHLHNAASERRGHEADGTAVDPERNRGALRRYARLCADIRLFLDAELGGSREPFLSRASELRATPLATEPHVELVPIGVTSPPPYDLASDRPPSPRQLGPLLDSAGAERTCAILARFQDEVPKSPLYSSTMACGSLLFECVEAGKLSEAQELYAYFHALPLDVLSLFTFGSDICQVVGRPADSLRLLRAALAVEPGSEEVLRRLRELDPDRAP